MSGYIDIPKSVPAWHLRWRRLQEGERNRKTLSFMLSVKQVKRFSVPLSFHLINQLDLKSLTEIYFFILHVNAMFSTFISLNNIHLKISLLVLKISCT